MRFLVLIPLALLAGCSSFKLGAIVYVPHGQSATVSVQPPATAASQAQTAR